MSNQRGPWARIRGVLTRRQQPHTTIPEAPRVTSTAFLALAKDLSEWGYILPPSTFEMLYNTAGGNLDEFRDLVLAAEGFDPETVVSWSKRDLLASIKRRLTST